MLNKKGFTLIELLIVITIIGILAVAFLPSLLGAPAKARDTQRIADVQKLAGILTTSTITGNISSSGCVDDKNTNGVYDNDLDDLIKPADFGGKMINDPANKPIFTGVDCHGYWVVKNASTATPPVYKFAVIATLENPQVGGNRVCAGTDFADIDIDGWTVGTADSTTNCYVMLLQ